MNPRQKSYDSYDKTTKLLKLTNSYYHFKNLESIKNRNSQYGLRPMLFNPNKKYHAFDFFQMYNIKKQNQNIKSKIKKILLKPIKPIMNDTFITKDQKMKKFRKYQSDMYNRSISKANEYFKKRLYNQKAFINSKMLDKLYNSEHAKSTVKIKRLGDYGKIVLPQIKGTYDNISFLDFVKNYNIETARSGRDEESVNDKIRRKYFYSLSDTTYDNKKDSGNNSLNK